MDEISDMLQVSFATMQRYTTEEKNNVVLLNEQLEKSCQEVSQVKILTFNIIMSIVI